MKDFWHLHSVDWLDAVSPEQRERLRSSSVRRKYDIGEIVFTPVPSPESLYLLESGLVRIYRLSESGLETTLGYVKPGEVFGELTVLGDFPRESFAQASEASVAWKVPRRIFQPIIKELPSLGFAISKQIGERLKYIESRVENLVFRDVEARIMLILLELAEKFGEPRADGGTEIVAHITQAELATLVGSTRQSVNATFRELTERGLLERHGKHLVLPKPEALRQAAVPSA